MEGSGDVMEPLIIHENESMSNMTADEPLLTGDAATNEIVSKVADIITTGGSFVFMGAQLRLVNIAGYPHGNLFLSAPVLEPYSPAHLRIGWLAIKCLFTLLVFVLTVVIRRRDYMKTFLAMLLIPILLECGFDIYTEIRASMDFSGRVEQKYSYFEGDIPKWVGSLFSLQPEAIKIYGEALTYYTTYKMFETTWWIALVEYTLSAWLFWTSLFSSVAAFQYAHKAVSRPEEITYTHFFKGFIYLHLFVVLPLTTLDVLLSVFALPPLVTVLISVIPRFAACVGALFIVLQFLLSLILFCKRQEDHIKTSPYSQVRNSKFRLFWFILFQIVLQSLTIPYLIWAAISLEEDFVKLFNLDWKIIRPLALEAYAIHYSCFLLRPLVILIFSIVLLPPYRKKFGQAACGCCRRD